MNVEPLERFQRRLVMEGPGSLLDKFIFCLLVPISVLYGSIMWLRSRLYKTGCRSTFRSSIPVISVGNLAVGGTGKTPFVDYLLGYFENRGVRPAVVSRGYGGSFSGPLAIVSDGQGPVLKAACCGDEPYLLARKHPKALVLIAPRRREALKWINSQNNADVIILDDAFQHLQAGRDLDIVLLDAEKPFTNGFPLPAGLLREFPGALKRADLLVLTRARQNGLAPFAHRIPSVASRHQLSGEMESLDGQKITLDDLTGKRGVAFAGIAHPDSFFRSLIGSGLELVETVSLPDHEKYEDGTLRRLSEVDEKFDYYITTEKDAVKIASENLPRPCYVTGLKIDIFEDTELVRRLDILCDRISDDYK